MRLSVVRNVDIQPKFKTIYMYPQKANEFRFQILHGSGHFSVNVNDTKVADSTLKDSIITVYPKMEGSIEITVEDLEIPDGVNAKAELVISDIHKLELDMDSTLMEEGSSMDMQVTAFDIWGKEFDEDQYPYLEFFLEIEMTGLKTSKGMTSKQQSNNTRKFIATGHEPGTY